jgi:hypothetical protein
VESIAQHDNHLSITLSQTADTSVLVSSLVNAGAKVEEARKIKADLEDVFLKLMEEEPNAK